MLTVIFLITYILSIQAAFISIVPGGIAHLGSFIGLAICLLTPPINNNIKDKE